MAALAFRKSKSEIKAKNKSFRTFIKRRENPSKEFV
jgi:hypothetical protein